MSLNRFPSKLLEEAVHEFSKFPGIGEKTALRMVLFLLRQDKEEIESFGTTILRLKDEIKHCNTCYNISEKDECDICSDGTRDRSIVCVVENAKDVMSIENTRQYKGLYHVLGGVISPIDGIGPGDIEIKSLETRVSSTKVNEIILALSTTMEGDTTGFYIHKRLKNYPVKISSIAKGVAIGDELEYADELTLGQSIKNRVIYDPASHGM
jgi:recombination protein RecR